MITEEQIKELAYKRYGTDPYGFAGQRDGFMEGYKMCQESLQGIEDNNGWVKIEGEDDLPTIGYYEVIRRDTGKPERSTLDNDFGVKIAIEMYSHWKQIVNIDLPIY